MNEEKHVFLIIVALSLLLSCSSKKENNSIDLRVIDVAGSIGGGRVINLSEIASEILYVPLETTPESLVGGFSNENHYENGLLYYFMGDKSIKIFDKNGKYLKVLDRKGRGPQEYEYLGDFSIDYETGNLLVQTSRKIVEYPSEGNFVRNIDMPSDSLPEYNFLELLT